MRVLAFDTATVLTAVALRDLSGDLDLARVDDPPIGARPGHASRLLVLINDLFAEADSGWSQVDRIAVGVGPGTFTGLRIGIATAHALARSAGKPLVGVSTLASLALAVQEAQGAQDAHAKAAATLAVIDARRGEVFVAGWAVGQSPVSHDPIIAPRVMAPDQLPRLVRSSGAATLAVGDGALKFASSLRSAGALVPSPGSSLHRVSARGHCRLAAIETPTDDNIVQPQYLRVPDAELAK